MTASATLRTGTSVVVDRCQVCDAPGLEPVLFLGYLPPVNVMLEIGMSPREQAAYPAQVLQCPRCRLVQLGLIVDPELLFPPDYAYTSGTTRILRENFAQLAAELPELLPLGPEDLVVDIGANDGTLLSHFTPAHRVLGIEPTGAGSLAEARGIETLRAFFTREVGEAVRRTHGPAKLVTATNVFAHIENVHDVLEGILAMLEDAGVFVSESHYLLSLVDTVQYDTIYHEHLRYYALQSLQFLLQQHGLTIVHAKRIPTHGGSIRVYAARTGRHPVRPSVEALRREEARAGLDGEGLRRFARRVVQSKLDLLALLRDLKQRGARVYGIGAPSRASTLINYVGLDEGIIDCVLEIAGSRKIGKYIPGTLIPVVEESRLFQDPPACALLFSWHIAEELMSKLTARGFRGDYLIPLPTPRIVPGPTHG